MSVQISNINWIFNDHSSSRRGITIVKGTIESARFTCTCGEIWTAKRTASDLSSECFVQGLYNIIVTCPRCKQLESVPDSCYKYL